MCALSIREVKFEDVQKRETVNVSGIVPGKKRLPCQFCGIHLLGHIVRCSNRRCGQAFHITCAYIAGCVFETSDWPYPVYVSCHRHTGQVRARVGCGMRGDRCTLSASDVLSI